MFLHQTAEIFGKNHFIVKYVAGQRWHLISITVYNVRFNLKKVNTFSGKVRLKLLTPREISGKVKQNQRKEGKIYEAYFEGGKGQ